MKAVVLTNYGPPDVLQLHDIDKPTPKDTEVLIKVHASTVTAGDCEFRRVAFPIWIAIPLRMYMGITKPRSTVILGQELAGEVEAVGKDVTQFKVGDAVFGSPGFRFGGYAEYNCISAEAGDSVLAHKPTTMSYEEAAGVPTGGLESLHFLRKANLQPGHTILINGAGGSIGTFGIQLARHYGAEVTAVDSAAKLDMLRSIGADHVIDYKQEDFTKRGETYDVIFDVIGTSSFSGSLQSLKPNGRYLIANPRMSKMIRGLWTSWTSSKKVIFTFADRKVEDLMYLKELIEAGHLKTIIDRTYPLEQTAEAHRYVETGQKAGHVIIAVVHNHNAD